MLKNNIAHAPELYFERRHPFGKEVLDIVQGPGTEKPSVLAAIAHSAAVVMTLYCGGQSLASSKMYPNFNYIKMKDRSTKLLVEFYTLQVIETLTRAFCGIYCFLHIH